MSQDIVLHLGVAADGIGLSVAGPRAGPATALLGAQTGDSVSDGGKAVESGGTTFSPIVAGGSLMAHENAGGHMLERHAGQGKSDLSTRLKAEPKITGSSSFTIEKLLSRPFLRLWI